MKKLISILMVLIIINLCNPLYTNAESLKINVKPVEHSVNLYPQEKTIEGIDVDLSFLDSKIKDLSEAEILKYWNNFNPDQKVSNVILVDDIKKENSNIISPNKVIGSDGRQLVTNIDRTPFKQTVFINQYYLSSDSQLYVYRCSGAVVPKTLGGSRILTAAHCLYKEDIGKMIQGYPSGIAVYTGYNNGDYDDFTSATSIKLPTEFINNPSARQYDFGVIDLEDNLAASVGTLGLEAATSRDVKIGGYPADLGAKQYTMSGSASLQNNGLLHYTIDTYGGQSGAPILDDSTNKIIGVHSAAYQNQNLNLGVALDSVKALYIQSP